MILISSSIDRALSCVSFTSLSVRTKVHRSAVADSCMTTTRRRFTAHAQPGHVVIVLCTLTLHFLWISNSDNRGLTVL